MCDERHKMQQHENDDLAQTIRKNAICKAKIRDDRDEQRPGIAKLSTKIRGRPGSQNAGTTCMAKASLRKEDDLSAKNKGTT